MENRSDYFEGHARKRPPDPFSSWLCELLHCLAAAASSVTSAQLARNTFQESEVCKESVTL